MSFIVVDFLLHWDKKAQDLPLHNLERQVIDSAQRPELFTRPFTSITPFLSSVPLRLQLGAVDRTVRHNGGFQNQYFGQRRLQPCRTKSPCLILTASNHTGSSDTAGQNLSAPSRNYGHEGAAWGKGSAAQIARLRRFHCHYTATHAVTEVASGPTTQRRTVTLQVSTSSTLDSCTLDIRRAVSSGMESGHDGPGASTILPRSPFAHHCESDCHGIVALT